MQKLIEKYGTVLIYRTDHGKGLVKLEGGEIIPVYKKHFSQKDLKALKKGMAVCIWFKMEQRFVRRIDKITIIDEEIS